MYINHIEQSTILTMLEKAVSVSLCTCIIYKSVYTKEIAKHILTVHQYHTEVRP